MSILNVNKINPVGGGSTITISGIASVTGNVTAPSFVGAVTGDVTGNVTGNVTGDATGLSGNPSINTTGIITATTLNYTGNQNFSHRNIIINGAMMVAQRGVTSNSTGYQTVDRITTTTSGGIDNACTYAQVDVSSGTTPYTLGFRKAFKITNGDQSSIATNDYVYFTYNFESQDIANSGWNYTSTSSYITLSFWVKSSVAQEFHGYLKTNDGTAQLYSFSTGSLTADTWTKVTKTIPGNSNLQFDNNTDTGLLLRIAGYMGTYRTGSLTQNQWAAYNGSLRYPTFTNTWFDTNDATLEFTGLQLEVGPVATPFEHRSFGDELARCQRYFYRHGDLNSTRNYALMGNGMIGHNGSTDTGKIEVVAPVRMRQQPTVSVIGTDSFIIHTGGGETGTSDMIGTLGSGGLWTAASSDINFWIDFGRTSGGSPNRGIACIVYANNNGANLGFSAEL